MAAPFSTGAERWLAFPVQRDEQESIANMDVLPGYAFTPDSRAVVISYGGEIWRVPVDGGCHVAYAVGGAALAEAGGRRFASLPPRTAMVLLNDR